MWGKHGVVEVNGIKELYGVMYEKICEDPSLSDKKGFSMDKRFKRNKKKTLEQRKVVVLYRSRRMTGMKSLRRMMVSKLLNE